MRSLCNEPLETGRSGTGLAAHKVQQSPNLRGSTLCCQEKDRVPLYVGYRAHSVNTQPAELTDFPSRTSRACPTAFLTTGSRLVNDGVIAGSGVHSGGAGAELHGDISNHSFGDAKVSDSRPNQVQGGDSGWAMSWSTTASSTSISKGFTDSPAPRTAGRRGPDRPRRDQQYGNFLEFGLAVHS